MNLHALPTEIPDAGDEQGVAPDGFRLTDAGHAQRFIHLTYGTVRYVHKWGKWIVYSDGRWSVDTGDALITESAKVVARSLMAMVPSLGLDMRDRVYKAALKAESAGAIAALVRLARGIEGVLVDHDDLDADPYLLNCTNGTVDLRTGELRPHVPGDLCTQQCPVAYDPGAAAPLWLRCLETWQPDPDVREYLQREVGAGACGRQTETLSVHYGQGGNGKSKFFGAVMHALGTYAVVPHKSLIIASKHEQHATVLASLFRARLAVASETSAQDWLDEAQVKNLTGGDQLAARRMREDEWKFMPSHTLVTFSNHRPAIRGTDEGMWRRVRLIPWDVTIPAAERDETLSEKLAEEGPGILRWVVEGTARYLSAGITPPAAIAAASADYRATEDTVNRFLRDAGVVFDARGQVPSSELTRAHEAWCLDAGLGALGHWKRVAAELTKQGAVAGRAHGARVWRGITLQTPDSAARVSRASRVPVNPREDVSMGITGVPDARDTENTFSLVSEVSAKMEPPSEQPGIDLHLDRDGAPLTDDRFASDDDEFPDVDVANLEHPSMVEDPS
jgi:putative DNA primase/helicase